MKKIIAIFASVCLLTSCGNSADKQMEAQQKTLDSMKVEMVKQATIDSMNEVAAQQQEIKDAEKMQVSSGQQQSKNGTTHNSYTTNTTNYGSTPVTTKQPKKKKGWSAKAKGAVIGTGVGAITGAIVDKKRGEGAVVGGLLGAAAGLGAGAIIDKNKKDKEEGK